MGTLGRLGWVICLSGPDCVRYWAASARYGPQVLGKGLHGLGNGPHVLGNGPHLLGIMSHLGLCRIRHYVVPHYVTFGVMSFSIMLHAHNVASGITVCCIRTNVIRDCVGRRNVARVKVSGFDHQMNLSVVLICR